MKQCQAQAQSVGEPVRPRFLLPESEPQQLTEHQSLGAADSGLSDATQAPNWLQRWAALFMPGESDEQSQASMQQWMSSITAAMHQAQQEGVPLPPAQEVLASLMSLGSVQSPALLADASLKGLRPARHEGIMRPAKPSEHHTLPSPPTLAPSAGPLSGGKRVQPMPGDDPPQKKARVSQTSPQGDAIPLNLISGGQHPWSRAPILIQQHSNPDVAETSMMQPKASDARRSSSKSHFRVYSNAFQEPLPSQRLTTGKLARDTPQEDARNKASETRTGRLQHMIVTGASKPPRSKEPELGDSYSLRRAGKLSSAASPQGHNAAPTEPRQILEAQGSLLHAKRERAAVEDPLGQQNPRHEYARRGAQGAEVLGPIGLPGAPSGLAFPSLRSDQASGNMDNAMAAAWLRQHGLAQAVPVQEGSIPPFAASEAAYVNALSKAPTQAVQQLQGDPAVWMNLQLQQLATAQSRRPSVGLMPWQAALPLSHSVPPALPGQEQWREALMMQAAKTTVPAGPGGAKVYYQQTWPADKDSALLRRPFMLPRDPKPSSKDAKSTLKQPVPRRLQPEPHRPSPSRQSPGHAGDAQSHLEQMILSGSCGGRETGMRPVADLPTDRSWSTPVTRPLMEGAADMPRAPSMDSSMSGAAAIDVNNPFEVHREQMNLDLSPGSALGLGQRKSPARPAIGQLGSASTHKPAFHPVSAFVAAVKTDQRSQSPPARKPELDSSPSLSPQRFSSRTEDEKLAAQTLLSLFKPPSQELGSTNDSAQPGEAPALQRPRPNRQAALHP